MATFRRLIFPMSLVRVIVGPLGGAERCHDDAEARMTCQGQASPSRVSPAGCGPSPSVLRITGAVSLRGFHRTVTELYFEARARLPNVACPSAQKRYYWRREWPVSSEAKTCQRNRPDIWVSDGAGYLGQSDSRAARRCRTISR